MKGLGTSLTLIAVWLFLASAARGQLPGYGAEIEVARILVEARVVDAHGEPVVGLGPADFTVKLDDKLVQVEDAVWVASPSHPSWAGPMLRPETGPGGTDPPLIPTGRLMVFLFQVDFHASRLSGLIRMSHRASDMLAELRPEDLVAVAVFGSQLQLHSDFSSDFHRLDEELPVTALVEKRQARASGSFPSLAEHFDARAAREAATMNQALRVLGEALRPLPGPKSIVLFGWGIGRLTSAGIWLGDDYAPAVEALNAAQTAVYSMDVTRADYHSLEAGLRAMSADTGGFYEKTHLFPDRAMNRLTRSLSGYYELTLLRPDFEDGVYPVEIRVSGREITVHASPWLRLIRSE